MSPLSWYFIEPSDVWFFRDALPYDAGEGGFARSLFPPSPATLAGAFRSYLLAQSNARWDYLHQSSQQARQIQQAIGDSSQAGSFRMQGPFFASRTQTGRTSIYAPLPAGVYRRTKTRLNAFRPVQTSPFQANWKGGCPHPLWPPHGARQDEPPESGWLDKTALEQYLQGNDFSIIQDLSGEELRLGIALEGDTKRPRPRMLYNTAFLRLNSRSGSRYGLLARVEADDLPERGCLQLGGEGRSALFEKVAENDLDLIFSPPGAPKTTQILLLLLTPAWFKDGWQSLNANQWTHILGKPVKRLVTAALGRPLYLGGWDLANPGHKSMLACFPPGSTFYLELETPSSLQDLQDIAFTQSPTSTLYQDIGFGRVAVGLWDWQV